MLTASAAKKALQQFARSHKAIRFARFFKTGKGEYAHGDIFIGVKVPETRQVAKKFKDLKLSETLKLIVSKIHEERLLGLFILIHQFKEGDGNRRDEIYNLYVKNLKSINNWDLVDTSAPFIVGPYLENRSRRMLYKWARSKDLWEKRISIISTQHFIRKHDFQDALNLCELLLNDGHDLIHKATGWMLREIGKRDKRVLIDFLNQHAPVMPRTMLRYSIEHFSPTKRREYLKRQ